MTGKSINYEDLLRRWKCDREQAANDLEQLLLRGDELPSPGAIARAIVTLRSDLQPVTHAHWVRTNMYYEGKRMFRCSMCSNEVWARQKPWDNSTPCDKFCARCGAKMDEEVQEDGK